MIINKVYEKISKLKIGKLYTIDYFSSCGNRKIVSNILAKAVKQGKISRVIRGVYAILNKNPYIGDIILDYFSIAKVILKKEDLIQIQDAEAARIMGFTTQVPVKTIFYISSNSRYFHIGRSKILLKKVNKKRLVLAGSKAGIALAALRYIGKNKLTVYHIKHVYLQLSSEEFNKLYLAEKPKWMSEIFIQYKGK